MASLPQHLLPILLLLTHLGPSSVAAPGVIRLPRAGACAAPADPAVYDRSVIGIVTHPGDGTAGRISNGTSTSYVSSSRPAAPASSRSSTTSPTSASSRNSVCMSWTRMMQEFHFHCLHSVLALSLTIIFWSHSMPQIKHQLFSSPIILHFRDQYLKGTTLEVIRSGSRQFELLDRRITCMDVTIKLSLIGEGRRGTSPSTLSGIFLLA